MGSARRLIAAALALGAAFGCDPPAPAVPEPPRRLRPALAVDDDAPPCPGGLLCEDPALLGGFRVPLGCVRRHDGRYAKTCVVVGVRPAAALGEFLTSRYPASRSGDSWWIDQPGIGALRVELRGELAEFIAMPSAPSATER